METGSITIDHRPHEETPLMLRGFATVSYYAADLDAAAAGAATHDD